MNRYEKYGLTDQDLTLFKDYVDCYASDDNQSWLSLDIPVEDYLSEWEKSKSKALFSMFNGKLIHKESVCFKTPFAVIQDAIRDEFLNDFILNVVPHLKKIVCEAILDGTDYSMIRYADKNYQKERTFCINIFDSILTSPATFAENKCVIGAEYKNKDILSHPFSISKEQKPFKAIGNLLKIFFPIARAKNPDIFDDEFFSTLQENIEQCRLQHSRILNTVTMKGDLCLSIHPLDYITASDNNYGWDSCMAWMSGDNHNLGEYRLGTVEMMNSPIVVVAYLEGKTPFYPVRDSRTWSNKKWREFFIVDRNIISSIRGYPYAAIDLEQIIIKKLAAMAESIGYPKYQEEVQSSTNVTIGEHKVCFVTDNMYNDAMVWEKQAICSSDPIFETFDMDNDEYVINYSGVPLCINCGRPFQRLSDEADKVNCEECEGGTRCAECHALICEDDGDYFDIGTSTYCHSCVAVCDLCQETVPVRDSHSIYVEAISHSREINDFVILDETCYNKVKPYLHTICDGEHGGKFLIPRGTEVASSSIPEPYRHKILNVVIEAWGEQSNRSRFKLYDFWKGRLRKNLDLKRKIFYNINTK